MIKHIERVDDDFFNHLNQIIDAVNNFTPEKSDDTKIDELRAEIKKLDKKFAKLILSTNDINKSVIKVTNDQNRLESAITELKKTRPQELTVEKVVLPTMHEISMPKETRWQKIKKKICLWLISKLDV